MKVLKENNTQELLETVVIPTIIPPIVHLGFIWVSLNPPQWLACLSKAFPDETGKAIVSLLIAAATCVISVCIVFWLRHTLPKLRRYRTLGKHEGYWLQIIPYFDRPYTIMELKYIHEEYSYQIRGWNYSPDLSEHVYFKAYRIVERNKNDGFYFITDHKNDITRNLTNGLGKICFEAKDDKLTRAHGYFIDVGGESIATIHQAKWIKCDKEFYNYINDTYHPGAWIEKYKWLSKNKQLFKFFTIIAKKFVREPKLEPLSLMEYCNDFAKSELEKNTRSSSKVK